MSEPDLNLIRALDALLTERSVTKAAAQLGLSVSAMSRALSRLRSAMGDQLLVQAGRELVATPYAEQLTDQVHALAMDVETVLRPARRGIDIGALERSFRIRANAGFIDRFGPSLISEVHAQAPNVRLQFVPKLDKDAGVLREGKIDLEIGVASTTAPEVKLRRLFSDHFVGICHPQHSLLRERKITVAHYANSHHVVVARRWEFSGPVDRVLEDLGIKRHIAMVVPSYTNAINIVRKSNLIGLVPHSCLNDDHTADSVVPFELPISVPPITVSLIWHPRYQADPAHQWLRQRVQTICESEFPQHQ